jgi:hypothetical protein
MSAPQAGDASALPGPLHGLRVLELADEKGQFCGKLMADLGAGVIKIEPPGGQHTRLVGPSLAWTKCCRSSAALYSLFSRRSPSSTAFLISWGRVTLSSYCNRSTSSPSFCFSASIICSRTVSYKKLERPT